MQITISDGAGPIAKICLVGKIDIAGAEVIAMPIATLAGSKRGVIVDLSGVTSFEVSVSFLKEIASSEPILPTHLHRVIVAPTGHIYGLSRMFGILSEKTRPNLEIVRTMDEALKVLRIDAPNFQCIEPSAK